MAILSDYLEPKLLDHIFQKAEYTRTNLYLGISTVAFTESDTGITAAAKEPGYNSSVPSYFGDNYSRVRIDSVTGYDSTKEKIANRIAGIDFAEAGGSGWGDIAYWAIFDGNTSSDDMLMHGSFSASVTVASGSQFRISTGDLEIIFPTILNNAVGTISNPRAWRNQMGFLMGFNQNQISTSSSNSKFYFHSNSTSGFTDNKLYLAVSASAFPADTGLTASENSGTGYARVEISGTDFNAASTSGSGVTTISNSSALSFPEAQSDWGDMAFWAIFRGGSSGVGTTERADVYAGGASSVQPLLMGSLTASKTVNTGDVLRFGVGDFVVTSS